MTTWPATVAVWTGYADVTLDAATWTANPEAATAGAIETLDTAAGRLDRVAVGPLQLAGQTDDPTLGTVTLRYERPYVQAVRPA